MYQNIITKEYINDNIRPFSGNDSLYEACVREAIMFDLSLPTTLITNLLVDDIPEDVPEGMLEQLRLCIGYFTYSRAMRSGSTTITKYGVTTKTSQDSYPADTEKIQSDSIYYKNCAENILCSIKSKYCDYLSAQEIVNNKVVRDNYLKCSIIGD